MVRRITSIGLTTCDAIHDGAAIRLDFVDQDCEPISIEFPFAQAQSIVMTLPVLLSRALRQHTADPAARFVFGLGRWTIENADGERVIMTLATDDGFEVSFGIPFAACRSMGWALSTSSTEDADKHADPSDVH